MKTLSIILCAVLTAIGFYFAVFNHNFAGVPVMLIGALAYLLISRDTKKIAGYNKHDFMNR